MYVHLKPQDVLVAVKLSLDQFSTFPNLAGALGLSLSGTHGAVRRAETAGLLGPQHRTNRAALLAFLVNGVRYVFPPKRGRLTLGMPTAHAAPPLNTLVRSGAEPPPVWPGPQGR